MNELYLYTDGACRGNPGPGGVGLVLYQNSKLDKIIFEYNQAYKYTTNNQMEMRAFIYALYLIAYISPSLNSTIKTIVNQDFKEFYSSLSQNNILSIDDARFNLCTDSKYIINGLQSWINNWKKNNWLTSAKKPVKNQELWQIIDSLWNQYNLKSLIKLTWVKGHNGNKGNDYADFLATNIIKEL